MRAYETLSPISTTLVLLKPNSSMVPALTGLLASEKTKWLGSHGQIFICSYFSLSVLQVFGCADPWWQSLVSPVLFISFMF